MEKTLDNTTLSYELFSDDISKNYFLMIFRLIRVNPCPSNVPCQKTAGFCQEQVGMGVVKRAARMKSQPAVQKPGG